MYKGAMSALVLPFRNGKIDEEAYREFIEWQIQEGIQGLVPCGTTGESATLTYAEHEQAINICIDQVKKRVPVIAGCGSNNTLDAIAFTEFAKKAGADAAMLITPYYNKPTQEGLFRHYKAINDAVSLSLFVYNVPSRTGCNVCPSTMARMYKELPNIIGIKEATGNLAQVSNLIELTDDKFVVLIGDDHTVLSSLALGAMGTISVTSNVMPKAVSSLCNAWFDGNVEEARRLHYLIGPLNRAMFIETNPIPVKTALYLMGKMDIEMRLPLCELSKESEEQLSAVMRSLNLI